MNHFKDMTSSENNSETFTESSVAMTTESKQNPMKVAGPICNPSYCHTYPLYSVPPSVTPPNVTPYCMSPISSRKTSLESAPPILHQPPAIMLSSVEQGSPLKPPGSGTSIWKGNLGDNYWGISGIFT